MIDIDHFTKFNDRYGHQAGDNCLRSAARTIAEVVSPGGEAEAADAPFAARYGGEEFAVVVPGCSREQLEEVAARMNEAVRKLAIVHADGAGGVVTLFVGGTHLDKASGRLAELFRSADRRLYAAKQRGRDCAEVGSGHD